MRNVYTWLNVATARTISNKCPSSSDIDGAGNGVCVHEA